MKNLVQVILILLLSVNVNGQELSPTKKGLARLFKETFNKTSQSSNYWIINNHDGSYFKSDTLDLYKGDSKIDFCEYIRWTFNKKKKFYLDGGQTCKEPSTVKVRELNNYYRLKVVSNDANLILQTTDRNKKIEKYEVLSFIKTEEETKITIKRMRNVVKK